MLVGMRIMVVERELSTTENPESFQHCDFLNRSTRALERGGKLEVLCGNEGGSFYLCGAF